MSRRSITGMLAIVSLFAACTPAPQNLSRSWLAMGTTLTVTVPASEAKKLDATLPEIRAHLETMEACLSIYNPRSDISLLNATPGKTLSIAAVTENVLRAAVDIAERTEGAFDPAVAPLVQLWGFGGGNVPTALPATESLEAARAVSGYQHLVLPANGTAMLAVDGAGLDLGGIAKGAAVDRCFAFLRESGLTNIMVNLGGNIRCSGASAVADTWRVGIRDPFDRSRLVGRLALSSGMAVATSGNYEQFWVLDGRRYTHIVDPRTGMPVEGMAGVTVVAPDAMTADALSTACFVLGIEKSLEILERFPGCEALFIPDAMPLRISITTGLQRWFTPEPGTAKDVTVSPSCG